MPTVQQKMPEVVAVLVLSVQMVQEVMAEMVVQANHQVLQVQV